MKLLFLCTTEFQLLTALNMKYHMYPDDIADIIVDNYHGEEAALAERLVKTKLFRKVCYVNSHYEQKTLHAYLRGISDGKKTVSFGEALSNTLKFTESRIKKFFLAERGYLSVLVQGFDNLSLDEYDEFLAYGGKPVTRSLNAYIRKKNQKCRVVQIDEGIGSYYIKDVGDCPDIDGCALYEPELRTISVEAIKIPKISRKDKSFLEMVNFIFEYEKGEEIYQNSVIFFDQGISNPLPKYLKNASVIKRILFHNSYRRHKREEFEYNKRTETTLELLKRLGEREVWIKPHPRSSSEALKIFSVLGKQVKMIPNRHVPWEVIALNSRVENNVFLTCISSSVCLYPSVIDDDTNKSVLLYTIYGVSLRQSLENYLKKLENKFAGVILLPKNKEEYTRMINIVGG